ncbi:MAG: YaeQ family protein [bacterium]
MKIRCELHINGGTRRVLLAGKEEETAEHLALRLSACMLFWEYRPAVGVGPRDPALSGMEFLPDLMGTGEDGRISLWVECGNVTVNKLSKLSRRLREARIVVLKESREDGLRLRAAVRDQITKEGDRIEILCWPAQEFRRWAGVLEESNHAVGEAQGCSLNMVLNESAFAVQLLPV